MALMSQKTRKEYDSRRRGWKLVPNVADIARKTGLKKLILVSDMEAIDDITKTFFLEWKGWRLHKSRLKTKEA